VTTDRGDSERADVLVLGAGPAGAAGALALARAGCSVTLVGRAGRVGVHRPRIGETVPPAVIRPLARLGIWEAFLADGHKPAPGTVVLWGDEQPYEYDHIIDPYGCGWHLDRDQFDATLLDAARHAGARVHLRTPGGRLERDRAGWSVPVAGPTPGSVQAPVVVDATGRAACVARRCGAGRVSEDRLIGLVRFGRSSSTDPRTVLEACAEGWWYAAGLPRGRAVTMLCTDADLVPRLPSARAQFWDRTLSRTGLVKEIMAADAQAPIHTVVAHTDALGVCAGPDWVAVGDAARTQDPLSGQGITTACASAIRAAEAIVDLPARSALSALSEQNSEEHSAHLRARHAHYRREDRWLDSPFWARRHRRPARLG